MQLIDGKRLSSEIKTKITLEVANIVAKGHRPPHLAVILVGLDAASQTYVRSKEKACLQVGFGSTLIRLDYNVSEEEVLKEIARLNADDNIDGILVQLPLPKHISEDLVIDAIDPRKDVDGFHKENVVNGVLGRPTVHPCTPLGIIRLLESVNTEFNGANAVVIGRSNIVGRPCAQMLLQRNATVTTCHSRTKDLKQYTKNADILVVAVGKANLVTADMIGPNTVIIDAGINRLEDGRLVGDVDFEGCKDIAKAITPVPGGVGPMTIACLLENTLTLYQKYNF